MQVLVALPVPNLFQEEIAKFRAESVVKKYLRASRLERHVTLVVPEIVTSPKEFTNTVRNQVATTTAISLIPNQPAFIAAGVLVIDLDPKPFKALTSKLQPLRPHITIGRALAPLTNASREQLLELADRRLSRLRPKLCSTVHIYSRPTTNQPYRILASIPLNGS